LQTLSAINNTSTLSFKLTTPVDDARPIYITGSFNDWKIDDERFKMTKLDKGEYYFNFNEALEHLTSFEYKYIRGGWENVELDDLGNHTFNRIAVKPYTQFHDYVPRWKNYGLEFSPSYLPKIQILNENFYIPQLNTYRKVYALLPHNYTETDKSYPVIYMQDAQNLFDDQNPYGNWQIDKKLAAMAEVGKGNVIIIAIEHGHGERVTEFLPFPNQKNKKAKGRNYIQFIQDTLKPYVDANFRTLKTRENTGIGGSSMGGLISMYAGLMYPNTFGKIMILSPSFWAVRNIPFNYIKFFNPIPTKIYLYAGGKEGSSMVELVNHFQNSIQKQGFDCNFVEFKTAINPDGTHSEYNWGNEFPKAVDWLFNK
jgi:predicted alpha/beta superfamily hydrolase